jgi:hypothetical protein
MKKSKRIAILMLPILVAYLFQATQFARAPIKYNFFAVYAKNADIALTPGSDLSPNGQTLLQNASAQEGLYNLTLGQWGPGYRIDYTDAFNVTNREVFNITMVAFNFSATATGTEYLRLYVYNDTDQDGYGEDEILAWDGTQTVINSTNYCWFQAASSYGNNGGTSRIKVRIELPETGVTLQAYTGTLYVWFTSG